MTDWNLISHAYGPAGDIPGLLDRLRTDPSDELWQELWSCLCHQGTVYPASFAALTPLTALAASLPPSARADVLMLVGAIIASNDLYGLAERPASMIDSLIPALQRLAEKSMAAGDPGQETYVYLLQAASAFAGHLFWGRAVDGLATGGFPGGCPTCAAGFHIMVGDDGYHVIAEDAVGPSQKHVDRQAISPARAAYLQGAASWLYATASGHGQTKVSGHLLHVFGTTSCPACGARVRVESAIRAACAEPGPPP